MEPDLEPEELQIDHDQMRDKIEDIAAGAGEDWASDTLYDARNNPSIWQSQYDSAEDYIASHGQNVVMDIADGIVNWGEQEVTQYFKSLPRQSTGRFGWGDEPNQTQFKEFVADVVYDGITTAIKKAA